MERISNEQITETAQPAAAEERDGASQEVISLGKFKDVNALLNAYNSLQAEFTKRSQRLKELEGELAADKAAETAVPAQATEGEQKTVPESITEENKKQILSDYLKEVLSSKSKAVLIDGNGVGVTAPREKPKTISDAGKLAKEIL